MKLFDREGTSVHQDDKQRDKVLLPPRLSINAPRTNENVRKTATYSKFGVMKERLAYKFIATFIWTT